MAYRKFIVLFALVWLSYELHESNEASLYPSKQNFAVECQSINTSSKARHQNMQARSESRRRRDVREYAERLSFSDSEVRKGLIESAQVLKTLRSMFFNRAQSRQFIQSLRTVPQRMITGNYQLLAAEIIERGSYIDYYNQRRTTDMINDLPSQRLSVLPNIPVSIGYIASTLTLLRAFQGTVMVCMKKHQGINTDCIAASTALTVTVVLNPFVKSLAAEYAPLVLSELGETALSSLSSIAPATVANAVRVFQKLGVAMMIDVVGKTLKIVGTVLSAGVDIYNIATQSMAISKCSQPGSSCTSLEKDSDIISVTFSCLSILLVGGLLVTGVGFVVGALLGLALMAIKSVALAVNTVVYYHKTYGTTTDEGFRLFWHSMMMMDPPTDVRDLAQRTDAVRSLEDFVMHTLAMSPETVVAYGLGIGAMVNNRNVRSDGSINMEQSSKENTEGLSRVQPKNYPNTTRLCLPKWNGHEDYDKWNQTVATAVYRCKNTFMIADAERWKKRNESSYMVFNLANINEGIIVGSNIVNNVFQINSSRSELTVVGGRDKLVNIYVIQDASFHGTIQLSTKSQQNVLDLSASNNNFTSLFNWDHELNMGIVQFNSTNDDAFYLSTERRQSFNLHVIGRKEISDVISCQSGPDPLLPQFLPTITADGGGGESDMNMDILTGCKVTIIRPFTKITSPDGQSTTYATEVSLESAAEPSGKRVQAIVEPKQSHYSISFKNRPLFSSIFSLRYIPSQKTLVWELQYTNSTVMVLSILPYHTTHLFPNGSASSQYSVTCVFNDNFFNASIFPIIANPRNSNETIDVRVFNVIAPVNSSLLVDVADHYHKMMSTVDQKWSVVTRLADPMTNSSFIFGSNMNDTFHIDEHLQYLLGGNGPDIYILTNESSERIWIDNKADDDALDTLLILPDVCSSIWGRSGSVDTPGFDSSAADVTLICLSPNKSFVEIVLKNYDLGQDHQHLRVYWRDEIYQLPPNEKVRRVNEKIVLTRIISVDKTMSVVPAVAVTSNYNYIFNITGSISSLVAYREGSCDLILVEKEMDSLKSLFIQLIGFFRSEKNRQVSSQWLKNEITMTSDKDSILKKYNISDILKIPIRAIEHDVQGGSGYHEYFINMTDPKIKDPFESCNDVIMPKNEDPGLITVVDAEPKEFNASWAGRSSSSRLLELCIPSKNCCHTFQRPIYHIEFIFPSSRYQSVVIRMSQFACDQAKCLDEEFINAQTQLKIPNLFDDSDRSQLRRCVGSLYADKLSHSFMYKLFGFSSIIDQLYFMKNSCKVLFGRKDLMTKLSREEMHDILIKLLDEVGNEGVPDQESFSRLRRNLSQPDGQHQWDDILKALLSIK